MHLFLIRHGETEHNVAGLLAGVTDSRLTNHGLLQAKRLGQYLSGTRKLRFTHLYASDLQRAWMTADELRKAQEHHLKHSLTNIKLGLLREQDFGSHEMTSWTSRRAFDVVDPLAADFRQKESTESMRVRANQFIDDYIAPLWALDHSDPRSQCVAVVSHGMFLATLWRTLLFRFEAINIHLGPEIGPLSPARPLEYIASWSNTGYLEADIRPVTSMSAASLLGQKSVTVEPTALISFSIRVLAINCRDHLVNLQKTRGGVGSAAYDTRQKPIDGFFKRPMGQTGTE